MPAFPLEPLRPLYTLVGDEAYVRDQFRQQLRQRLPEATLEYGWMDEDLALTPLEAILDGARSPSLMAPVQVYWMRNARELFGRGSAAEGAEGTAAAGKKKHGAFPANLEAFVGQSETPAAAVLVLVADHVHLPAERARIPLEDKGRLQHLETVLGALGPMIPCGQANEAQAATAAQHMARELGCELSPAQAQRLTALCDAHLALMQREVEKLALYQGGGAIADSALEALVVGAAAASAYDLAEQIARGGRGTMLGCLHRWWSEEGAGGAIGLIFQLSRIFAMALICRQERVRDRSGLYQALPEGLRPPGFAADSVLAIAARMEEAKLRRALPLLHRADVELRSSPPSVEWLLERLVLAISS